MRVLKRSAQSILSLKKRTLVLFVLFFVVSIFLLSGMFMKNSLTSFLEGYQSKITSILTIEVDSDKILKEMYSGSSSTTSRNMIDNKLIEKIEKSSLIRDFSAVGSLGIRTELSDSSAGESSELPSGYSLPENFKQPTNNLEILDSVNPEVSRQNLEILEGSYPYDSGYEVPILVSKKFAEENNLRVGEKFSLDLATGMVEESKEIEATICGVYELTSNNDDAILKNETSTFYTDRMNFSALSKEVYADDPLVSTYSKVKIELKDPMDTDKLVDELKADGTDYSFLRFDSTYDKYKVIKNLVSGFLKIINLVIVLSFIIALIILALIMILSLRERKYEIGLLLALGEGKFKIIYQLFLEVFIIMVAAFGIATLMSEAVTAPIVTNVISRQLSDAIGEENLNNNETLMQKGPNYVEDTDTKLEVNENLENSTLQGTQTSTIVILISLIFIVFITTALPGSNILRKSPNKILNSTE